MIALSGHTLIGKASSVVGGTIAGASTFAISEVFTGGNLWTGLALSAVSSIAVAWFTSRPKTIRAQSEAEMSERDLIRKDFAALWERAERVHLAETAIKDRQLDEKEIENKLLRITKHNALKALQHAHFHIYGLEAGRSMGRFEPILMEEISGQEDRQTQQLVVAAAARMATTAATAATAASAETGAPS